MTQSIKPVEKKITKKVAREICEFIHTVLNTNGATYCIEDRTQCDHKSYLTYDFKVLTDYYNFTITVESNKTYTDVTFRLADNSSDQSTVMYYSTLSVCTFDITIPASASIMFHSVSISSQKPISITVYYKRIEYIIESLVRSVRMTSYVDDVKIAANKFIFRNLCDDDSIAAEILLDPLKFVDARPNDDHIWSMSEAAITREYAKYLVG